MDTLSIALFGEAEKGSYHTPYFCNSLPQLEHYFGNPPAESHGLFYAVQTILYERPVIFLRVREEGFSEDDYYSGLHTLEKGGLLNQVAAFGIPGVGDQKIIEFFVPICQKHQNFMIIAESDLYDLLTCKQD